MTLPTLGKGQLRPKFNRSVANFCAIENEGDAENNIDPDEASDAISGAGNSTQDNSLAELKKQLADAKRDVGRNINRAKSAEKKLEEETKKRKAAEERLKVLEANLGDSIYDSAGFAERLEKLKDFEAGLLKDAKVNADELKEAGRRGAEKLLEPQIQKLTEKLEEAQAENEKLKKQNMEYAFTGRVKQAMAGIVKPKMESMALAGLVQAGNVKYEDGQVMCYEVDNQIAVDSFGNPESVEDFIPRFMKDNYQPLIIENKSLPTNGPSSNRQKQTNPFKDGTLGEKFNLIAKDRGLAEKLAKQAGDDIKKYLA